MNYPNRRFVFYFLNNFPIALIQHVGPISLDQYFLTFVLQRHTIKIFHTLRYTIKRKV